MDTYAYIYNHSFNYSFPNLDILSSNDDAGGASQFMLTVHLQSMTKYILVVTTFFQNVTGKFSIIATGPGLLWFSRANISGKNSNYLGCFFNQTRQRLIKRGIN